MITVNGNLEKYCEDCPYMELESLVTPLGGSTIYGCTNQRLCAFLFERFKQLYK
jgi:hypothetical protein